MNLNEIIQKSKEAYYKCLKLEVEPQVIINEFKTYIKNNFDLIEKSYYIDKKERLYLERILSQFDVEFSEKSELFQNQFGRGGNLQVPYGIIGVISSYNIYNVIRLINLAFLTRNSMIFNVTEDYGTNYFLLQGLNQILKYYKLENFIQLYNNNAGEVLEENEQIDALIYIGKKNNANRLKISTTKPVIFSGCGNYEFYVDELMDEGLINQALEIENMSIYSRKGVGIGKEISRFGRNATKARRMWE